MSPTIPPPGHARTLARRIVAALALALAVALCWWPRLNTLADQAVDTGLKRALVSFATARTLHGVISVVQGTELAVQPMGMGVTLTPGRLLTPINELTAQVADWMLWASVAFGLQKLLLEMGTSVWVGAALTVVALAWLGFGGRQRPRRWLSRLLVTLLFARLVMPVTVLGSEQLFAHFLAQPYEQSQLASTTATEKLQALDAPPAPTPGADEPPGLLDRLRQWGSQAGAAASHPMETAQEKLKQINAAVDQLVERLVTLIAVFALQTLVLPLMLAWALWQLCRGLFQPISGAMASAQS